MDPTGRRGCSARSSDEAKREELEAADVLCAPSLGGESFGMVLTEAFAAGTPVVASDIAGYRDVVRDGVDGVLVPPADPPALAEALRDLDARARPPRRDGAGTPPPRCERFAWPRVAAEVMGAYEDAIAACRSPQGARAARRRAGRRPARRRLKPHARARATAEPRARAGRRARRRGWRSLAACGLASGSSAGAGSRCWRLQRIGLGRSPPRCSLAARPGCCSALGADVRLDGPARGLLARDPARRAAARAARASSDALQGTFIGVLMSATLPARLGEPARALIVARRTGRPRENLPVVLGTLVSQTLLNIVALVILGAVMFSSVDLFNGHQHALAVRGDRAAGRCWRWCCSSPALLRGGRPSRSARLHALLDQARGRDGPRARRPRRVPPARGSARSPTVAQLSALGRCSGWPATCCSIALGPRATAGFGAAAAVLFAVNVTAVLPATPSNLGVFQAACVAVLHTGSAVG